MFRFCRKTRHNPVISTVLYDKQLDKSEFYDTNVIIYYRQSRIKCREAEGGSASRLGLWYYTVCKWGRASLNVESGLTLHRSKGTYPL